MALLAVQCIPSSKGVNIALEGLPGQKAIADDILVFGAGVTDDETQRS